MISSSFSSTFSSDDGFNIILTMTKPLIIPDDSALETLAKTFAVFIDIAENPVPIPVSITFRDPLHLILILIPRRPIHLPITITYKATDTSYLTGINGNVDNINNMELTFAVNNE